MIEPGSTATASLIVTGADLAGVLSHTPEDAFPPVFATSRMIGLMELAAARVIRPVLRAGEVSVGVSVEIQHTAATPVGARVDAEARFAGMEGKLFVFEVAARDAAGEIGRGRHRRAIVEEGRLLHGARRRGGRP
jgi:fluoroacetyl-CoA thioesterase